MGGKWNFLELYIYAQVKLIIFWKNKIEITRWTHEVNLTEVFYTYTFIIAVFFTEWMAFLRWKRGLDAEMVAVFVNPLLCWNCRDKDKAHDHQQCRLCSSFVCHLLLNQHCWYIYIFCLPVYLSSPLPLEAKKITSCINL
jgi:hypothetical protein